MGGRGKVPFKDRGGFVKAKAFLEKIPGGKGEGSVPAKGGGSIHQGLANGRGRKVPSEGGGAPFNCCRLGPKAKA